jgi:hypothetical protein
MKKRYILIGLALFFVSFTSYAQEAPMRGWHFNSVVVTLNGKVFWDTQYAESWREQDGYAIVLGIRRHYWLYDSYSYYSGRSDELLNRVFPAWVESMGYAIDFDNIWITDPNPDLASSVKALMTQRGCDISVTLLNEQTSRRNTLVINNWNRTKNVYDSTFWPLIK